MAAGTWAFGHKFFNFRKEVGWVGPAESERQVKLID